MLTFAQVHPVWLMSSDVEKLGYEALANQDYQRHEADVKARAKG